MFEQNQNQHQNRSISITQISNLDRQHPSLVRVERLKDQLKQEKLQDKVFYQQIKRKIATR